MIQKIKKGMMFAAINGENNNGIDFCDKALKAGATTILCSKKELNKIIKKKANILTTLIMLDFSFFNNKKNVSQATKKYCCYYWN